jgi:signal transduction histidine kinase
MRNSGGLRRRLGRAFLLQASFIGVAAVLGVYVAAFAIEELLIKRALEEEAAYYWANAKAHPDFPLPDTLNLTGYLEDDRTPSGLPGSLTGLPPGFHQLEREADFSVAYVEEQEGQRLFLLFDGEQVGQLALYFGLFPLMGALLVVYVAAWLAYRATRQAVSPIIWLAREVQKFDPSSSTGAVFELGEPPGPTDQEVLVLADALSRLSSRITEFVERERNFTRDASHELRSPLTVIRIAADMLLSEQELDRPARNSVLRIKRAAADMEELTEAFLLLARESDQGLPMEPVLVNNVVAQELERAQVLLEDKALEIHTHATHRVHVTTSEKALSILVGNLVRNAFSYTEAGRVDITIAAGDLTIEDSGVGIPEDEVDKVFKPYFRGSGRQRGGHGVGLTIVKRLSDRFEWPVVIESEPGVGTRVIVRFSGAECEVLEHVSGIE